MKYSLLIVSMILTSLLYSQNPYMVRQEWLKMVRTFPVLMAHNSALDSKIEIGISLSSKRFKENKKKNTILQQRLKYLQSNEKFKPFPESRRLKSTL